MHDLSRGRIVVTGGAGLIGSAVLWALNRRGLDDVLIVDRLDTSEKWKHLVPLRFADYLDADEFERYTATGRSFGDVRTVIHLGACSSTTETDAGFLLRNNYEYTKRLALWTVGEEARFIYASSAATYGGLEAELSDEADLHSLRPLNGYAYSKHLFDLYSARTGLDQKICGLKYFNVFGPNEDHKGEMRSLVHKAFAQIRESGRVRLFKSYRPEYRDGEQQRDFIYIKDAVEMTLFLTECGRHRALQRRFRKSRIRGWSSSRRSSTRSSCRSGSSSSRCRLNCATSINITPARPFRSAALRRLRPPGYAAGRCGNGLRHQLSHSSAPAGDRRSAGRVTQQCRSRACLGAQKETMSQSNRPERRRQQRGGAAPPPRRDPMRAVYIGHRASLSSR